MDSTRNRKPADCKVEYNREITTLAELGQQMKLSLHVT